MPRDADFTVSEDDASAWAFIDPTSLQHRPIPERKFIVQDWLAPGHVTINFGDGGVGKTLLSQQLMASCATGKPWCGLAVERCRSLGLFCEDDESELHRRQDAINRAYDIDFRELAEMTWATGVGLDNTLISFDADDRAKLTAGFNRFSEKAKSFGAGLIVVDTAADTFGGNENVRRQVRQFVGFALGRMAIDLNAAVLLNAHPSRAGLSSTGDQDGGSTAWSNTARTRWSLTRPKAEQEGDADPNERILTRRKANYAAAGDTLRLRWQAGVLAPVTSPAGFAAAAASVNAEGVFLDLLARWTLESRPVSDNVRAGNYAPKMFASSPDRQGFGVRDFGGAMQRLFATGKIAVEPYGRQSDMRHRIAIAANSDAGRDREAA